LLNPESSILNPKMPFTLQGIGVSEGIAIGRAHLVSHASLEVDHFELPAERVADECARFDELLIASH